MIAVFRNGHPIPSIWSTITPIPLLDHYTLDGSGGNAVSLQNLIDFAKAQGKPIAIAETGAGNSSDGAGLSDNPTFVQWLSSTLTSSGVEVDYVSIWNSNSNGTYDFTDGDKPQEAAAWAKYFGADSGGSIEQRILEQRVDERRIHEQRVDERRR